MRNGKIFSKQSSLCLIALIFFSVSTIRQAHSAEELRGASSVINEIKELTDKEDHTNPKLTEEQRRVFANDMEHFSAIKNTLSPEQAAAEWVSIVERFMNLPQIDPATIKADSLEQFRQIYKTFTVKSLFEILPDPESWEAIEDLCQKKSEQKDSSGFKSILFFIGLLNRNPDLAISALDSLEDMALEENSYNQKEIRHWFDQLEEEARTYSLQHKSEGKVKAFEMVVKSFESFATQPALVKAPDLLNETDRKTAAKLLERALNTPNIYLEIPSGQQTRKLGVEVALANLESLKRPQWGLIQSLDSIELYEKLHKKFVNSQTSPGQDYDQMVESYEQIQPFEGEEQLHQRAVSYYILGLLNDGRIDEALQFINTIRNDLISPNTLKESLEATENSDLLSVYVRFLENLLSEKPEMPFWDQYVTLSLIRHNEENLIKTIHKSINTADLSSLEKLQLQKNLITVLLAKDEVEEAIAIFSDLRNSRSPEIDRKKLYELAQFRFDLGHDFYELGKILEREDLIAQTTEMLKQSYRDLLEYEDSAYGIISTYKLGTVVEILSEQKNYYEAEELILYTVREHLTKTGVQKENSSFMVRHTLSSIMAELAKLYSLAEMHEDVLALYDKSPWWNAPDLSRLYEDELLLIAAKALNATGEPEKAVKVIKGYIIKNPNDDDAYRLLVDIAATTITPWLDRLYETDRFEERPLIWKAYLLKQDGRFNEAEDVIREAMRVDPTDGEQEAGQRIYSYTLLSEILEAQGKQEEADFFRDVVESVRIAEQGDILSKAGLVTRSIDTYRKAMALFADAYCIQWRLAERLYATGDIQGARNHYKIAFERMPEQFGQVASFCFGCEGAFDKMESRSAAEEVFIHLLETTPDKPQVYFLYGLLRKAQKRIPEAYSYYKKAVKLDPGYLDAWKEISKLSESVYLPREEKDRIIIKMLSLDPRQKHFSANFSEIRNWKDLWGILEKNQHTVFPMPEALYLLSESAEVLQQAESREAGQKSAEYFYQQMQNEPMSNLVMKPGIVLSNHELVSALDYLVRVETM